MRLQPLYDLQQDINRLFIAGSKFAKGDPRLQKHIATMNKLGEKAPVFKKLAADMEELLNADTQQSAEKLMSISTLLYSVLYTQGELTEPDMEEKPQAPNIDIKNVNTVFSYLQLKPVIEALTTSNSGRLEVLKDAMERNIFADSRTYQYLDIALGDKYAELCDYVEKTIIPKVGKPMIPFLLQKFNYEDKTENARRFRLLHQLGLTQIPQMIEKIFSGSLPALQAEAISVLSEKPENEPLIIQFADDKNKLVREAAYLALARLNTQTSLEKLKDVYVKNKNKTNLPPIVKALASSKLPFFFTEVFEQVSQAFREFVALDKTTDDKILVDKFERFLTVLEIFENKCNDEVLHFLSDFQKDRNYIELLKAKKNLLGYSAQNIIHKVINILNTFPEGKVLEFWENNMLDIPNVHHAAWSNYFEKAHKSGYSKEKMFDTFSNLVKKKTIRIFNLYSICCDDPNLNYYSGLDSTITPEKIDPRWIEILYEFFTGNFKWDYELGQALRIIDAFEPSDSERFKNLLISLLLKLQPGELPLPFKLIMEREYPNRFELIFSKIEKFSPNTYYYVLNQLSNLNFWKQFPKEYVEKFTALHEKTKLGVYAEIAAEINSASSQNV